MHRFKISRLSSDQGFFWLHGAEKDHLVRVLRIQPGETVAGFDNSGREWLGKILSVAEDEVSCQILAEQRPEVEARLALYLAAGLAKGEKFEWVIQKGTELGMAGFLPLQAKRSVVQLAGPKAAERVERWQKIAAEATKQSGRVCEPQIFPVSAWHELPGRLGSLAKEMQWLIPYEEEKTERLLTAAGQLDPGRPVGLLIGPEGGFEPAEVAWAQQNLGARSVSLGPRILRAETAAVAALALVLGQWGDLG